MRRRISVLAASLLAVVTLAVGTGLGFLLFGGEEEPDISFEGRTAYACTLAEEFADVADSPAIEEEETRTHMHFGNYQAIIALFGQGGVNGMQHNERENELAFDMQRVGRGDLLHDQTVRIQEVLDYCDSVGALG